LLYAIVLKIGSQLTPSVPIFTCAGFLLFKICCFKILDDGLWKSTQVS